MKKKLYWFRVIRGLFKNWPSIYWSRIIKRSPQILQLRNGIEIEAINPNTIIPIVAEIWHNKQYGDLKDIKSDNPVIIDIGAHIGIFSLFALSQVPNATVLSFEPSKSNAYIAYRNIEMNGFAGGGDSW